MSCQAAKCLVNLHDVIHDTTASCCADHYVLLSQDMLDHFTLLSIQSIATHTLYCGHLA